MKRARLYRKAARVLIAASAWISPANTREWTAAMSAELEYVEGSFGALVWAAGCFGTALKQLCISIVSPGALAMETEGNMSKFAKISAAVLIVASALFLFAPTFRQGVRLTASSWRRSDDAWLSEMRKLGTEAEARHDAQALAFVAMQLNDAWESDPRVVTKDHTLRDKFADEAVQWDANLTWIYYPILSRDRSRDTRSPNDSRWMARLEEWDPSNAAVHAREASFYMPRGLTSLYPESDRALLAASPKWLSAIDNAFSASEYDSYISRKTALDLKVSQRYGVDDPARMLIGIAFYPVYERSNFELYAKDFLLREGADFEAEGELSRAEQSYWKISHLGELIQLRDDSDIDNLMGIELQLVAGPKLQDLFEKTGNAAAAKLVAYQTTLAQQTKSDFLAKHRWTNLETEFRPFDAWAVQLSLLGMAISLALILCCLGYFAVWGLLKKATRRSGFFRLGLGGTGLLFASAIAMYFSFAPYAEAFQNYLAGPNLGNAFIELARFRFLQELPLEVLAWFWSDTSKIYFWYATIALGGAIITWILYRHISQKFSHSAPVQPAA